MWHSPQRQCQPRPVGIQPSDRQKRECLGSYLPERWPETVSAVIGILQRVIPEQDDGSPETIQIWIVNREFFQTD